MDTDGWVVLTGTGKTNTRQGQAVTITVPITINEVTGNFYLVVRRDSA
jgi:hypothetical protein